MLIWNTFPTSNGQAADVVIGRDAFGLGYGDAVAIPPTASSMSGPTDVYFDGMRLFVSDTNNHRVMVWNGIPTTNGQAADYFVGQGSGTSGATNASGGGPNASGLNSPSGVVVASGSLFVSDSLNHRVLVFTPVPSASGAAAAAVLGQADFTTNDLAASPSATRISRPRDLIVADGKLFVVDNAWNRVTRYDLLP